MSSQASGAMNFMETSASAQSAGVKLPKSKEFFFFRGLATEMETKGGGGGNWDKSFILSRNCNIHSLPCPASGNGATVGSI